jgi:hypothetical protein
MVESLKICQRILDEQMQVSRLAFKETLQKISNKFKTLEKNQQENFYAFFMFFIWLALAC